MNLGELLNVVGLGTGVVLYAMLLAMVVRAWRRMGQAAFDPLLLATAILGLIWNLCALPAYLLPRFGIEGPFPLLSAIGFGALGLLPAVVVHSVLRGRREGVGGVIRRAVGLVAYTVSAIAAILHLTAALTGEQVPSAYAMRLLTYTFVALVLPLGAATRGQPGSRRALWVTALAVFAVSALHLSQLHGGDVPWEVELVGHHASLPLAFAMLYQDYPFALADLFLKRAFALLAVVTIAFIAVANFGSRSPAFAQFIERNPRQFGLFITLWITTALLYPAIRSGTAWFVDTVLLRRPDYRALRRTVTSAMEGLDDPPVVLTTLCGAIGSSLSSPDVSWTEVENEEEPPFALIESSREGVMRVAVPTRESPRFALVIAPLLGGRRLLSDDVAWLETMVVETARRIDAIRVTQERHARELREREISRLATEAELRALRAQINPHFLFNALTTIGYLIQTAPPRALQTLLRLTSLLRGVLRSEGEFSTLGREIEVVEAYLDIELARFEERLCVGINVPTTLREFSVPALVLQPIVENAVKHGIATTEAGGDIVIDARMESADGAPRLVIVVRDSGTGVSTDRLQQGRKNGVGLRNVERRLHYQYGAAASLSIRSAPGTGTVVEIRIPVPAKGRQVAGQVAV